MHSSSDSDSDDNDVKLKKVINEQQRKKKPKSGGFQAMGLSNLVMRGIIRKGYRCPTPIQRKTIPIALEGKDIVAMARTGSGKTAAFLIPMFERLMRASGKIGIKALILSPTRELALQTLTFVRELGRSTQLKWGVVVGGEAMEKQFAMMHDNPDILIATPGRLLHVLVEMNSKLPNVEYLVFDEADRLFEMGFSDQVNEIVSRVPTERQTLLFSATLPQLLVDFAKAGLHDPELIRLDVELQLSENLKTVYIGCKSEDKNALLLYLLKNVVKPGETTVVFTATRHHCDYLQMILEKADIPSVYVYSSLDNTARQINVTKFRRKEVSVLLVTDVAARGIDIPLLDNVINYNFPCKPKLFVHRVGRVARAGRIGTAYSLIAFDEAPYLHELNLFIGKKLQIAKNFNSKTDINDSIYGFAPQELIDEETDLLNKFTEMDPDVAAMAKVCSNAYKQYKKTRSLSSADAVRVMKEFNSLTTVGVHPLFVNNFTTLKADDTSAKETQNIDSKQNENKLDKETFLNSLRNYKPSSTIFEISSGRRNEGFDVMQAKRRLHNKLILKNEKLKTSVNKLSNVNNAEFKDENYLSYTSNDHDTEKGLEIERSALDENVFDLIGDDGVQMQRGKHLLKWDRKKKRFIQENPKEADKKKKFKTESGVWIAQSYKTNVYKKWLHRNKDKTDKDSDAEDEDNGRDNSGNDNGRRGKNRFGRNKSEVRKRDYAITQKFRREKLMNKSKNRNNNNNGQQRRPMRNELKSRDEILKKRILDENKRKFQSWRKKENSAKRKKKD